MIKKIFYILLFNIINSVCIKTNYKKNTKNIINSSYLKNNYKKNKNFFIFASIIGGVTTIGGFAYLFSIYKDNKDNNKKLINIKNNTTLDKNNPLLPDSPFFKKIREDFEDKTYLKEELQSDANRCNKDNKNRILLINNCKKILNENNLTIELKKERILDLVKDDFFIFNKIKDEPLDNFSNKINLLNFKTDYVKKDRLSDFFLEQNPYGLDLLYKNRLLKLDLYNKGNMVSSLYYYGFFLKWINDVQTKNISGYLDFLNKKNISRYDHFNIYANLLEKDNNEYNIKNNEKSLDRLSDHLTFFYEEKDLQYLATNITKINDTGIGHTVSLGLDKIKKIIYIIDSYHPGYFDQNYLENLKNLLQKNDTLKEYLKDYTCKYMSLEIQAGLECSLWASCFSYAFTIAGLNGIKRLVHGLEQGIIKESKDLNFNTIQNIKDVDDKDIFQIYKKNKKFTNFIVSTIKESEEYLIEDDLSKKFNFYFSKEETDSLKELNLELKNYSEFDHFTDLELNNEAIKKHIDNLIKADI